MQDTNFHVFQVTFDGRYLKISPEEGFPDEAAGCAYASSRAAVRWHNRALYIVVSGNDVVAVYVGAALREPPDDDDCDREIELLWAA